MFNETTELPFVFSLERKDRRCLGSWCAAPFGSGGWTDQGDAVKRFVIVTGTALLFWSYASFSKDIVEYCKPYTAVSQISVNLKKPFIQYQLSVEDLPTGKKAVVITGDQLIINRENMGVIVRAAASVDNSIESIKFDARIVRFVDTVPIANGSLTVLADEIEFADGSSIAMLPNATTKLTFAARKITLSQTGFKHFDVRARQGKKRDDFSDIASIMTLSADQLFAGTNLISDAEVKLHLAKRFTRYPVTDFSSKIDSAVSQSGHLRWVALERSSSVQWPRYTIAVLKSAFKVSPFDDCTRDDIRSQLSALRPTMLEVAEAGTIFDAQIIVDSADRGIDLDGNGPAFATVFPLGTLLAKVKEYEPNGAGLAALDFYSSALAASAASTPVEESTQNALVAQLNEKIRDASIQYSNTDNELTAVQTNISASLSNLTIQEGAYKVREARLKEHAEDLKRSKQDKAQLISALSTAAAIATTAYTGSPQTGSAVGGIVYAVGDSEAGKKPFESLSAGIQFANAIKGPLSSVSKTISEIQASRETYSKFIDSFTLSNITIKKQVTVPVTNPGPGGTAVKTVSYDEALRDLAAKGQAMKDGIDGLEKVYKDFTARPSEVSPEVEEDDSLRTLAKNIADTLEGIKLLTLKLDALQRTMQEQSAALVSNAEQLSKITTVPIQNEARRRFYEQLAIEGTREELAKFAGLIEQIRRVSIVEFWRPLPIGTDQLQNLFVSQETDSGFDENFVLASKSVATKYLDLVNSRKQQVQFLARFVGGASEKQFNSYVQERGAGPNIELATEEISGSAGAPQNARRFITQLNQLISEQYHARKDPQQLQRLYDRQLELPLDVREKLDPHFPIRLLQVVITDIRPKYNLGGSDLTFRVEVDRVGNLRKSTNKSASGNNNVTLATRTCATPQVVEPPLDCFSVDLRAKTTPAESQRLPFEYTIGTIVSGHAYIRTRAQSFWYLRPGDSAPSTGRTMMVTYPPAEARMFLKVRLDPRTSWESIPVFNRLTVSAEVFQ